MRSGCGWHGSVDACWHLAPLTHIRFQCPPINLISTSDFTKTNYRQEFKRLNVQILDGDQAIASSDGDDPHALQLQPNWDFMAWYLSPHYRIYTFVSKVCSNAGVAKTSSGQRLKNTRR